MLYSQLSVSWTWNGLEIFNVNCLWVFEELDVHPVGGPPGGGSPRVPGDRAARPAGTWPRGSPPPEDCPSSAPVPCVAGLMGGLYVLFSSAY